MDYRTKNEKTSLKQRFKEVFRYFVLFYLDSWSGKRDSNSRPQPWQGCALPTELFPQFCVSRCLSLSRCQGWNMLSSWGKVVLYQLSYFRRFQFVRRTPLFRTLQPFFPIASANIEQKKLLCKKNQRKIAFLCKNPSFRPSQTPNTPQIYPEYTPKNNVATQISHPPQPLYTPFNSSNQVHFVRAMPRPSVALLR